MDADTGDTASASDGASLNAIASSLTNGAGMSFLFRILPVRLQRMLKT